MPDGSAGAPHQREVDKAEQEVDQVAGAGRAARIIDAVADCVAREHRVVRSGAKDAAVAKSHEIERSGDEIEQHRVDHVGNKTHPEAGVSNGWGSAPRSLGKRADRRWSCGQPRRAIPPPASIR